MSDIKVGTPVLFKFGDILNRQGTYMGSGKRSWHRFREEEGQRYGSEHDKKMDEEHGGFIIGQRTLSNGDFTLGWASRDMFGEWDGENNDYRITETFQAYLVVESLRSAPVKIRVEDVEVSW